MDRSRKRIASAVGATALASAALLAAVALTVPATRLWRGEGDWAACATVSPLSPDRAVRIAFESHGSPAGEASYASVTPAYLNETGEVFSVTCGAGIQLGEALGGVWSSYPGGTHFVWWVVTQEGICTNHDFVDWTAGEIVVAARAC